MISVRRSAGSSRGSCGSAPSSRLRSRASRIARSFRLIESLWRYGIGVTLQGLGVTLHGPYILLLGGSSSSASIGGQDESERVLSLRENRVRCRSRYKHRCCLSLHRLPDTYGFRIPSDRASEDRVLSRARQLTPNLHQGCGEWGEARAGLLSSLWYTALFLSGSEPNSLVCPAWYYPPTREPAPDSSDLAPFG